jgi:peptide deformylase
MKDDVPFTATMTRRFRSRIAVALRLSMAISISIILLLSQQQMTWCYGLLQPTITTTNTCTTTTNTRRAIFRSLLGTSIGAITTATIITPISSSATTIISNDHPFVYSNTWTGTNLKIQSLNDAVQKVTTSNSNSDNTNNTSYNYWTMGKWPDPILRRPANPIDTKMWLLGSSSTNNQEQQRLILQKAATILRNTARREGAVGLAAQQCGVDAKMIYLSSSSGTDTGNNNELVFINPRIVDRSIESNMNVWTEECLVLPPTFRATVLRDDWIDIEYDFSYEFRRSSSTITGEVVIPTQGRGGASSIPMKRRFFGEHSRCLQHELDHDRGILITDHVGLDELENDTMRQIETNGHTQRMELAYSRE